MVGKVIFKNAHELVNFSDTLRGHSNEVNRQISVSPHRLVCFLAIIQRAKGTRNFATLFMKAMTKSVTITENGKRKKISKLEAAVTQLANDAARGDKKAIQLAVRDRISKTGTINPRYRRLGGGCAHRLIFRRPCE